MDMFKGDVHEEGAVVVDLKLLTLEIGRDQLAELIKRRIAVLRALSADGRDPDVAEELERQRDWLDGVLGRAEDTVSLLVAEEDAAKVLAAEQSEAEDFDFGFDEGGFDIGGTGTPNLPQC